MQTSVDLKQARHCSAAMLQMIVDLEACSVHIRRMNVAVVVDLCGQAVALWC